MSGSPAHTVLPPTNDAGDNGPHLNTFVILHIVVQTIVWGFVFPIGMVLGLTRSKYHVPLQTLGLAMTSIGFFLGHKHRWRHETGVQSTAHAVMARIIIVQLVLQAASGIYLKLHPVGSKARTIAVRTHGILGKTFPIVGWTQMLLGVIAGLGYCLDGETPQCLAHYIMGSAFNGYACIMLIMLHLGSEFLKRQGQSQEYLDSWVIMLWGIVNTFTMHHDDWLHSHWSHKDMQHTMLGVLWWSGGLLGIFLSRKGKRSFVPALIIFVTGWGMSAHEQSLMISSKIHGMFGYSLMAAGASRVVEICLFLQDGPSDPSNIKVFQYLPPYLLILGGTMFMSATNEEMRHAQDAGIDHVTYGLGVFSISFLLFLHMTFLIHLYSASGRNAASTKTPDIAGEGGYEPLQTNFQDYRDNDTGNGDDLESLELDARGPSRCTS